MRGMKPSSMMAGGLLAGIMLFACGCVVTEVVKPIAETTLSVAKVGDTATLSWVAQPGFYYTITYADRLGANKQTQWLPVPGAVNLTVKMPNETMIVQDRAEARLQRRYNIMQSATPFGAADKQK